MSNKLRAFVLTFCLAPIASHAVVVWDESVDGDLSGSVGLAAATDLGALGPGTYDIIGTLDGGPDLGDLGTDEQDSITFLALGAWTFDVVAVTGVDLVAALFDSTDALDMFSLPASGPTADLYGSRGADSWSIGMVPTGNTGRNSYTVRINVGPVAMPAPATLGLLGAGLLGVALTRRRRRSG